MNEYNSKGRKIKYKRKKDILQIRKGLGKENHKKLHGISIEYAIIFNTPPQVGAYRSYAPSLLQIYVILKPLRDLVKMSASWSLELTKLVVMLLDATFSLMK